MRSLRFRLLVGSSLSAAAILVLAGAILYALIRRSMLRQFDADLDAQVRVLASQAESDNGRVHLDFDVQGITPYERGIHPAYFELWQPDGHSLQKSPSLEVRDGASSKVPGLVLAPGALGVTHVVEIPPTDLPNGRPAREACLLFALNPREGKGGQAVLAVARDVSHLNEVLEHIGTLLFATGAAALLLLLGLMMWVVRKGLAPVNRLGETIRGVREDDLSVRLPEQTVPAELAPLVDSLNHMLGRLDAAFSREKALTSDVAHELRTPLYGLRSKLEVSLSKPRDAEAYRGVMRQCLAITEAVQAIVENLLTLARLDAGQAGLKRQAVNMAKLAGECWLPFADRGQWRGLTVSWQADGGTVETDPEKVRIVLGNVFDNAVGYADLGGRLCVEGRVHEGRYVLEVANTGSAVRAEDAARVFDRFWRGDAARADAGVHCGLGLALSRQIMGALGHGIEVESKEDGWFRVKLVFDTQPAPALAGGVAV